MDLSNDTLQLRIHSLGLQRSNLHGSYCIQLHTGSQVPTLTSVRKFNHHLEKNILTKHHTLFYNYDTHIYCIGFPHIATCLGIIDSGKA